MDPDKLMCKQHWYMVPADLRPRMITAWKSLFRSQQTSEPVERERRHTVWADLKAKCIEAVQRKLNDNVKPDGVPAPAEEA